MDESGGGIATPPKRERTRRALIAAAAELIGERGYEGTSLEAVAARAGMTRGAIYGNFASREELFLAVAKCLWRPAIPGADDGPSAREVVRRLGPSVAAEADARRAMAVGAASFHLYALKNPALRERLLKANGHVYRTATDRLLQDLAKGGLGEADLPVSADHLVKTMHALTEGLMLMRFLTPELVTDEVIVSAFELLARAMPESRQL
jgi:AcrR family transcriptional regulator